MENHQRKRYLDSISSWQERRGLKDCQYGLFRKVLLRPVGNVTDFMPAYTINAEEITLMGKVAIAGVERACQ